MKLILAFLTLFPATVAALADERPNIILIMADDMGWGQTGYMNHPYLKTPNLDAMAANGLRFRHFYAGASNCSPTRATVLTGRSNDRTGAFNHGHALRLQEKTVAQALKNDGYATGHFGKWHLNGIRGPGIPIFPDDPHGPGAFGFEFWFSVSNFFDRDPLMSRQGVIEQHHGDSSEIIVEEAVTYLESHKDRGKPMFLVIWYGSPHSPMIASEADRKPFADLPLKHQHHLGELVAMDRSIGNLRAALRRWGLAHNTLLWFVSDNGGLPGYGESTVGGLRGNKGAMYEGGLRVPGIVEWPAGIKPARVTSYRAGTVDIFPTLAAITGLPDSSILQPQDGLSLLPLFEGDLDVRPQPLFFHHLNRGVVIDKNHKFIAQKNGYELYDLARDEKETNNLYQKDDRLSQRFLTLYRTWKESLDASRSGNDYPPDRTVRADHPQPRRWQTDPAFRPWLERFRQNVN